MKFRYLLCAAALCSAAAPSLAAAKAPQSAPAAGASLDALTGLVAIPYESFTLPNGLRVLVHTDRKAPVPPRRWRR